MDAHKAVKVIEEGDFRGYMLDENGKRLSIPETLRRTAKDLIAFHDKAKIALSEVLYEIYTNEYYKEWGFDNFQNYVESPELDFQYRQAMYLIKIWEVLIKRRGLPVEVLRNKSWSKLKEIAALAEHEEISTGDIKKLIEKSEKMTVEEVTFETHKAVEELEMSGKKIDKITRVTFNLYSEQVENLKKALDLAMDISSSDKSGANLDYICTSFIASHIHGDKKAELKRLAKEIEGAAGVKILVADDDGVIYSNKAFKDK